MNFLEQLAAEWYECQGYFVRTNAKANRRSKGGWDNELDVLAFNPGTKELVHLETSWDALTWEGRKTRFLTKKFVFTDLQYAELVGHPPSKITKRAIVGTSKASPGSLWGKDIHVTTVPTFVAEIAAWLRPKHPLRDVIPENFPRLRALQFGIHYGAGS